MCINQQDAQISMIKLYFSLDVEHLMKNKVQSWKFVHLVGLYTYCKMMHGTYNVK